MGVFDDPNPVSEGIDDGTQPDSATNILDRVFQRRTMFEQSRHRCVRIVYPPVGRTTAPPDRGRRGDPYNSPLEALPQ